MAVTAPTGPLVQVQLEVSDQRLADWFPERRPELVITNDVRLPIENRVEVELARNRVVWSGFFTGQVAQPERAPNPQREAADYLERAIDAAMASAGERGAFRELSATLESKAP